MPTEYDIITAKLCRHSRLDEQDIAALRTLPMQSRKLSADEDFIRQGDKPNLSALVTGGMVARYHMLRGGKRQYLSFHMTGDMPDAQTLFIERMDHGVCGIGPAVVAMIPHDDIIALIDRQPMLGEALWRETLIDAAVFREWIVNVGRRNAVKAMAHFMLEFATRLQAVGLRTAESFAMPLHQHELGDALGLSAVHVNRVLKELRDENVLDFRRDTVHVLSAERLRRIADFDALYLHQAPAL